LFKIVQEDPYIGFDDAEHPYAANIVEINTTNHTFNIHNSKHDKFNNKIAIINNLPSSSSASKAKSISNCAKPLLHSSSM